MNGQIMDKNKIKLISGLILNKINKIKNGTIVNKKNSNVK